MPELPEEATELYALEPSEFVAARNILVRRLRSEGRSQDATNVARRRRPSQTAWALNRLSRRDPDLVDDVIRTGRELAAATSEAIGGDRARLADVQTAERRAVARAVTTATELLGAAGRAPSDVAQRRIGETLRAAALDPAVAQLVRHGILETDMHAPAFGIDVSGAKPPRRRTSSQSLHTPARRRRRQLEADLRRARANAERIDAKAKEVEARARDLRGQAEAAADAARELQRKLDSEEPS